MQQIKLPKNIGRLVILELNIIIPKIMKFNCMSKLFQNLYSISKPLFNTN